MVVGDIQENCGRRLLNMFSFKTSVELHDDDNKPASREDFPSDCYQIILDALSSPGDWILFPSVAMGWSRFTCTVDSYGATPYWDPYRVIITSICLTNKVLLGLCLL